MKNPSYGKPPAWGLFLCQRFDRGVSFEIIFISESSASIVEPCEKGPKARYSRRMTQLAKISKVKGGRIVRDAITGRFISVETAHGVTKRSAKSVAVAKEVAAKRSSALKRLADR